MAAADSISSQSNEEWVVTKARHHLKTDPYAAKAWLLTGKTLFPKSFSIQYEAFNVEKNTKNITAVAKLLEEMFINFGQESQLWQEVHSMSDALQSDNNDEKTQFLRELFDALPSTLQCHMLLRNAETTTDVLKQCRLMLLILNRYPDQVPDHGIKLIDSLLSTEKHSHNSTPVNCYRKYLVCDVLPLVLKTKLNKVPHKHLYRWLQKVIEFYLSYITQPSTDSGSSKTDLLSPTKKTFACSRGPIPGLSEKEAIIISPWEKLFELVDLIASQLNWNIGNLFKSHKSEWQWLQLHNMYESVSQHADPSGQIKQVLHCTIVLFLHCLYLYSAKIDPSQFIGCGLPNQPLVLIESFKADGQGDEHRHKSKKFKTDPLPPEILGSRSIMDSSDIIQHFTTAFKCWELLHSSETMEKDFNKLMQHWKSDQWAWLKSFEIDVLIYQGYFREAISKLQTLVEGKTGSSKLRYELQTACCYYCLGNFARACEMILSVVSNLPQGMNPVSQPIAVAGSGRKLSLLSCSESEVLPYCIQLMISCFRERAFKTAMPDDMALGHMVVLMQYDWPRYEKLFCEVADKIKKQNTFTYNIFFNYVINMDMLEEFAFIRTQESGKVNLDILPVSVKAIAQTRTVTRGVNKGVKEDFKVAMEKQVSRNEENVETVIRTFLTDERDLLKQHLT